MTAAGEALLRLVLHPSATTNSASGCPKRASRAADVPDCLSEHLGHVVACTRPLPSALDARGSEAERAQVQAAGGHYVDVTPWLCTPATCAVVVANLLVFRDDNHLTTSYASWLAPVLAAEVDEALRS